MKRIAIIAAMSGELDPLVRGWQSSIHNGVHLFRKRFETQEWIAAYAGTGVERAVKALAEIEKDGGVSLVISMGWVGALQEIYHVGNVYWVSTIIDARTGERFQSAHSSKPLILVTANKVADAAEKRRLATTYQAGLVDMEAVGLARLAEAKGIPFYSLKGVSDARDENLPDFNRFISHSGVFRFLPFLFYVLLRPAYWPALMRMGENSKKASKQMAFAVLDFLDEHGYVRGLNDFSNSRQ
jgi:adenosylhomocysteine nucleosidase